MLRALPVDLEELAGILEGGPLSVGGRIDIRTGEVWPQAAIEYALETGEEDEETADPERWLAVHGEGSREGYRDMELFIASVEDPAAPSAWPSRSEAAARFAASRTSLPAGPASLSDGTHSPRSASAAARDHGSRRPATACCRSTTAIPENGPSACYQPERGTSHSRPRGGTPEHTLGREAEGILQSLLFHRASQGLRAQRATFRVLAEGDPDVDAAFASAVGCPPPPRSLTPPRPPLSDQRARAARGCGAAQIVRIQPSECRSSGDRSSGIAAGSTAESRWPFSALCLPRSGSQLALRCALLLARGAALGRRLGHVPHSHLVSPGTTRPFIGSSAIG